MTEIGRFFSESLKRRERMQGSYLTWAGGTYPCASSPINDQQSADAGGLKPFSDLTVVLRCDVIPSGLGTPAIKQTISYIKATGATAKTYRIDEVVNIGSDVVILRCNDPDRDS